ncbi:GNAT family N-acetyltransferase [Psychromonas sp. Urea-02u-13]|uniref:GNAT family N-acetyltransferase n=1 Tax=Psychromonas sp. Urea-02u-13 TaxID=2058326 RepID=UPI0012FEE621|nr:GNAT family N-acetyltransferase [Psychromonas sp. Urea-02u-13]
MNIRQITEFDWPALLELEGQAYSESLVEGEAVLHSKFNLSRQTCLALENESKLIGYVLALAYPHLHFPVLGMAEQRSYQSTNLHLHDLVIDSTHRGGGLAKNLFQQLKHSAAELGYVQISLVAVNGLSLFWQGLGFVESDKFLDTTAYGEHAQYMSLLLNNIKEVN